MRGCPGVRMDSSDDMRIPVVHSTGAGPARETSADTHGRDDRATADATRHQCARMWTPNVRARSVLDMQAQYAWVRQCLEDVGEKDRWVMVRCSMSVHWTGTPCCVPALAPRLARTPAQQHTKTRAKGDGQRWVRAGCALVRRSMRVVQLIGRPDPNPRPDPFLTQLGFIFCDPT